MKVRHKFPFSAVRFTGDNIIEVLSFLHLHGIELDAIRVSREGWIDYQTDDQYYDEQSSLVAPGDWVVAAGWCPEVYDERTFHSRFDIVE